MCIVSQTITHYRTRPLHIKERYDYIAKNLALNVMGYLIARILSKYQVEFAPGKTGTRVWKDMKDQFTANPREGWTSFSTRAGYAIDWTMRRMTHPQRELQRRSYMTDKLLRFPMDVKNRIGCSDVRDLLKLLSLFLGLKYRNLRLVSIFGQRLISDCRWN